MTTGDHSNDQSDQFDRGDGPDPIESDIRSAYSDLSQRAANPAVAARASMPGRERSARPGAGFRYAPSLVAAAVLAMLIGGAALLQARDDDQPLETSPVQADQVETDDSTDGTDPIGDDSDSAADSNGDSDSSSDSDSDSDSDSAEAEQSNRPVEAGAEGSRYRVATDLVAADVGDPYLNMRWAPGADAELLARLPATYAGLVATGNAVEVDDGGTWMQFELLDPVAVNLGEPLHGGSPAGWVNSAFVELLPSGLPIGTDDLAACSGDGSFLGPASGGNGPSGSDGWYVYGLESGFVADDCLRIVLTFAVGQAPPGGWEFIEGEVGPAGGTPEVQVVSSGGFGVTVDLPAISSAYFHATETEDDTFVVRQGDGFLDLISVLPTRESRVSAFPDRGIVVVDLTIDRSTQSSGGPPANGNGVHLLREPLISEGGVDLVGIARPFEANLGVRVLDEAGTEVEAVFSGGRSWGTRRSVGYSVTTDDWAEAWGRFALRIAGLDAGQYIVELEADGASDEAQPFRLPITVIRSGPTPSVPTDEEQSAALDLLNFAEWWNTEFGNADSMALADQVTLLLGADGERQIRSRAELGDRAGWGFDATDAFGYVGPFNIIDVLAKETGVQISSGPINHCAGPPLDWPTELDGLRQVNIEPVGIDTCLLWFGISLFLNGEGDIAAVALDLWEP